MRTIYEACEHTGTVSQAARNIGYTEDDAMVGLILSWTPGNFGWSEPCDNTFMSHPKESEWLNIYTDQQLEFSLDVAFLETFGIDPYECTDEGALYCMECRNWLSYYAI